VALAPSTIFLREEASVAAPWPRKMSGHVSSGYAGGASVLFGTNGVSESAISDYREIRAAVFRLSRKSTALASGASP
jgi:hypothetical protein